MYYSYAQKKPFWRGKTGAEHTNTLFDIITGACIGCMAQLRANGGVTYCNLLPVLVAIAAVVTVHGFELCVPLLQVDLH